MSQQSPIPIRPEVQAVLRDLRRRIRRYVFIEGVALVLVALGLLFWFSMGIDWAWFKWSTFELPVWFRMAFGILTITVFALGVVLWIGFRFLRTMRARALALVLERRFPKLDNRLITAVEAGDSLSGRESPLTAAMLNQTADEVARSARGLDLGDVFRKKPIVRATLGAVVLVASVVGFGLTNAEAMGRWARAYLFYDDVYWDRDTELLAWVRAEPGERIMPFRDDAGRSADGRPGAYKHPREGDLTVIVEVPEENARGKPLKVPGRVDLIYRVDGGSGTKKVKCTPLDEKGRRFQYTFVRQMEGMDFRVTGGDFTNRRPYRINVVDPPRVDEITLDCDYPRHTGLNETKTDSERDEGRSVEGVQISLPVETRFLLKAATNKPIVSVRVQYGRNELLFGFFPRPRHERTDDQDETLPLEERRAFKATLTRKTAQGDVGEVVPIPDEFAGRFLAPDRRGFRIPFAVSSARTDAAKKRLAAALGDYGPPLVIAPDSELRVYLEDTDEIYSRDPGQLVVKAIPDEPPKIEAEYRGVGQAITRVARIPVHGTIVDDYAVAGARFEFRVDAAAEAGEARPWEPVPFDRSPDGRSPEFVLQRSPKEPFELFHVTPLELDIGRTLALTVYAEDGDVLNGPNQGRSGEFVFNIVSREQLLSLLYAKEIDQLSLYEAIVREVEETRQRFAEHQQAAGDVTEAVAIRELHQVRKNHSEARAVAAAFRGIMEELLNNQIFTRQMLSTGMEGRIVRPLAEINSGEGDPAAGSFPAVDESIGVLKVACEERRDVPAQVRRSAESVERLLERMQAVLKEMRELVSFHKAVQDLDELIKEEEELAKQTRERRQEAIKKLKSKLEGLDDIGKEK